MTFALVAVTAGFLLTGAEASSTKRTPTAQEFSGVSMAVLKPLALLRPFSLWSAEPSAGPARTKLLQLENHRSGVTCTMRIMQVNPDLDAGIVSGASGPHPDPIVRNSASPCVE